MAVKQQLLEFFERKGIDLLPPMFEDEKHGWGQIAPNGGAILVVGGLGNLQMLTPWGEIPVCRVADLTGDTARDLEQEFGLKQADSSPLGLMNFGDTHLSITRLPDGTEVPESRILATHEQRNAELVQREWLGLSESDSSSQTIDTEAVDRDLESVLAIARKADEASTPDQNSHYDYDTSEALEELIQKHGYGALEHVLPHLRCNSPTMEESVLSYLDDNIGKVQIKDAVRANPEPLVRFIGEAVASQSYAPNTPGYTAIGMMRNIGPLEPERMVPILAAAIEKNDNCQWECDLIGEYGASAASAIPVLEAVTGGWAERYAQESLGKIRRAMRN